MNHHTEESLVTTQAKGTGKEPFFRVCSRGSCPQLGHVRECLPEKAICAHLSCELKDGHVAGGGGGAGRSSQCRNSVFAGPLLEGTELIRGTSRRSAESGLQSKVSERGGPGLPCGAPVTRQDKMQSCVLNTLRTAGSPRPSGRCGHQAVRCKNLFGGGSG